MKKYLTYFKIAAVVVFISNSGYAQNIWGNTWAGGANNVGAIFNLDANGNNQTLVHSMINAEGENPFGHYTRLINGKLYGIAQYGGIYGEGTIYEYDPIAGTAIDRFDFDGAGFGHDPLSGLLAASNGKLYGITKFSGSFNYGMLYEFNPVNGFFRPIDFGGTNGAYPESMPMQANNGKIYGVTRDGGLVGTTVGAGVIYRYDPVTDSLKALHVFINTSQGINPTSRPLQATNGKLYGMTRIGGTSSKGVLYEYNIATNVYAKKIDFNVTNGSNPEGYLIQATNGKIYGLTNAGGTSNKGTLFEYNIATNTLTKKFNFDGTVYGSSPNGTLMQAANGKLYGTTTFGGASNFGTLFEYDIEADTLIKKFDFVGANGSYPQGDELLQICNTISINSQSVSQIICNGNSITLTVVAAGANLSYQWFYNTDSIQGATTSSLDISNATANNSGYYYCKVSDNTCDVNSALIQITVSSPPNVVANSSLNPVCYRSNEILFGSGAQSYVWNYGVNNNVAFSADSSRSYIVTGTDINGCVNKDTLDLVVNPLPFVNAGSDMVSCPGASVTLNASGNATNYSWNNGVNNGAAFTIPSAYNASYTYIVTGTDLNNCSMKDTIIISTNPLLTQTLCLVTVDTTSTHNIIVWEKPLTLTIDSFKIYRVKTFSVDTLVGVVAYESLSEFHDHSCDPNATQYDYKISTLDTCGNESAKSAAHRTIHMLTNLGINQVNLQWNFYVGQNVNQYRVWRDSTMLGSWQQIATLSPASSSYTDNNLPGTAAWRYRIDVDWVTSCIPTARTASATNTTRSNTKDNYRITSVNNLNASHVELFPNPANESINIKLNAITSVKNISLKDAMGRNINLNVSYLNSNDIIIDLSELAKGIYFIEVNTNNGLVRKSFVKQ